ncbi:hypothetical protein LPTSP4_31710 [Leptospira ryugenii]|uniref:Trypsin-like peptidase domain protein n=1 Tax=Leptospira ryugenii TaxID=1917863 RepID=A0A2P2E431_9LEPT|nr:serine protease [Leptospira ryugenii]GBF51633.1 hypothetical protein LPTSP4_31710 [Leptospira ryugenii]
MILHALMNKSRLNRIQRINKQYFKLKLMTANFLFFLTFFPNCAINKNDTIDLLSKSTVRLGENQTIHVNSTFGTGFFISDNSYILTCSHFVNQVETVYVYHLEKSYKTKLVRKDNRSDLALLEIQGLDFGHGWIETEKQIPAEYGLEVWGMGSPFGEEKSLYRGMVSKPAVLGGDPTEPNLSFIQFDQIFLPGFSGAPLVDKAHAFVGIARYQMTLSESRHSGLGYAIPANRVREFLEKE